MGSHGNPRDPTFHRTPATSRGEDEKWREKMKNSYSRMVEAHEKSVVLGGAIVLFPVSPSLTNGFANQIRMAIERAENAAYEAGARDAQAMMRKAMGVSA